MDEYLQAREAAAILNVSAKTVSRWARQGRLAHAVTLGGHRRYGRGDIERLAEQLARPAWMASSSGRSVVSKGGPQGSLATRAASVGPADQPGTGSAGSSDVRGLARHASW